MAEIRSLRHIADTGAAWITEEELAWMVGEIKRLQVLLAGCCKLFRGYEMDADTEAPAEHRRFMAQIAAEAKEE